MTIIIPTCTTEDTRYEILLIPTPVGYSTLCTMYNNFLRTMHLETNSKIIDWNVAEDSGYTKILRRTSNEAIKTLVMLLNLPHM